MTDLTQAIADVKAQIDENLPYSMISDDPLRIAENTILNAVASGELIQLTDAKLAVALMVERAATHVRTAEVPREETGEGAMQRALLNYAADVVSLSAPASALAELQALRDDVTGWISNAQVAREKWSEYEARAEAAEADITTYQKIVADMTQEAEAAEAELAATQAKLARVVEALSLAANRLLRCSVDYDAGTKKFIEVAEWAKEARAELTTLEGAKP